MLAPGDVVKGLRGTYLIVARHGQGSFGVTYRAKDDASQADLIVKELRVEKLDDWKALELFEREGAVLATLSHPHIPAFRDFFAHGAREPLPVSAFEKHDGADSLSLVLVQELVPGTTLEARLLDRPLDPPEAERLLLVLLGALRHLHEHSPPLVHRDVKPGNIVVTPDGRPYLVDFGAIQTRLHAKGSVGSTIVGTLGYMPLEQIRGDARTSSDLYALGMTIVVALSGKAVDDLPFDDGTGKVDLHRALPRGVSPRLREALDAMVEPMVGHRAQSARELAGRLEAPPAPPAEARHDSKRVDVAGRPSASSPNGRSLPKGPVVLAGLALVLAPFVVASMAHRKAHKEAPDEYPRAVAMFRQRYPCQPSSMAVRSTFHDPRAVAAGGSNGDDVVEVSGCGHDTLFACAVHWSGKTMSWSDVSCTSTFREETGLSPPASASPSVSASSSGSGLPVATSSQASSSPPAVGLLDEPITLTWAGRLDASSGAAPPVGSSCSLALTLTPKRGGGMVRERVVFECKGATLYDANSGTTSSNEYVVGGNEAGELAYAYRMKASDTGSRPPPGAQLVVDTGGATLDAWRDTTSLFRVHAVMDRLSAPRYGKAAYATTQVPFTGVVVRSATVTAHTGKVPFSTGSCKLVVGPATYGGNNCHAELQCDGKPVYGDPSKFQRCTLRGGRPVGFTDPDPTPMDGDPELTVGLDVGSAVLADTLKDRSRYSVSFVLGSDAGVR